MDRYQARFPRTQNSSRVLALEHLLEIVRAQENENQSKP